jgi:hypothetical protein
MQVRAINSALRIVGTRKSILLRSQKGPGTSFNSHLITRMIECCSSTSGYHKGDLQFWANCGMSCSCTLKSGMMLKHYVHTVSSLPDGQISVRLFLLLATVSISAESYCYYTASFRLRPKEANRSFLFHGSWWSRWVRIENGPLES